MGFKKLYQQMTKYEGTNIFSEILKLWDGINDAKNYLNSLDVNFNLSEEDNWELYALSRVLDILTLRFQPNKNADGSEWPGPEISLNEL